ncbi:MAG: GntR family transcriptional regulator [Phycisphaerae bacterium]|jgi:GntR family transcriptional regulator|nr:GntR family transcriptional regulator [Phycisphaerae bacterium]
MLHLHINPNNGVPLYRQVAERLRRYVDSGLLSPGTRLPSAHRLATSLGINPATIVKAYAELEQEDIVEMKAQKWGRVTFLVSRVAHFLC